ncbi:MAG TPA: glycosyltransferase family 2 protein [Flavobacterium sp.]|nr:glycosyltransferase family 2 protein [Flavobacterium sp.]
MYEIAVILINYNSSSFTISCVKSILEKTAKTINFQIIIIDNNSKIEDYNTVLAFVNKLNNRAIILHQSLINSGFGGGNMLGVSLSNAKYYAFINNDTLLENDCLSILKKAMEQDESIGICGPLCHNEKGELLPTLDYFASPMKEIFGRKILHKLNPKEYPSRTNLDPKPQKGQFVSGSFMVVRAEDFWSVGGFDTNIFLYYEETDLCKRLAKIKKNAYLIPEAKYIHFHGASTPKSIEIKTELKLSLLYVIRKHYGYFWYLIILNKLRFQYFFKSFFKPSYWKLFIVLLAGTPLSKSLKYKQSNL